MKSHMVIVKITWENVFKTICNAQHIKSTNNIKDTKTTKQIFICTPTKGFALICSEDPKMNKAGTGPILKELRV